MQIDYVVGKLKGDKKIVMFHIDWSTKTFMIIQFFYVRKKNFYVYSLYFLLYNAYMSHLEHLADVL